MKLGTVMIKGAINQFRRIYADNGSGDHDFTKQEARLREASDNLNNATQALVRASDKLNTAALKAFPTNGEH
jgi:ABC-type transporter Mla subunit MlaD